MDRPKLPDTLVVLAGFAIGLGLLGILWGLYEMLATGLVIAMYLFGDAFFDIPPQILNSLDAGIVMSVVTAFFSVVGVVLSGLLVAGGLRAVTSRDVNLLANAAWWSVMYVVGFDLLLVPVMTVLQYVFASPDLYAGQPDGALAIAAAATAVSWVWSVAVAAFWYVVHINAKRHLDAPEGGAI